MSAENQKPEDHNSDESIFAGSGLFAELKRRKVFRVAATYCLVAWLIIQIASATFDSFGIPEWAFRFVVLLLVLGFPVALILSWAFDLTAHGLERTPRPRQKEAGNEKTDQTLPAMPVSRAVLASAVLISTLIFGSSAFYFYRALSSESNPPPVEITETIIESQSPAESIPASDKSVAVLPFRNMSADQANQYFCDGVQEDILTYLANLGDLHVVSRTSVMQYRDTLKSIQEIGRELNVAYILEGSVQRAGQRVRVTGQLINALTDEHLWAKNYDRDLTDIFAIQTELAREITDSLHAVIAPEKREILKDRGTKVPAAYDLVLKGRARLEDLGLDADALREIEALFHSATELDPEYIDAWVELANSRVKAYFWNFTRTPEKLDSAKAALDRAVKLAPENPTVIVEQGNYYYYGFRDYQKAREYYLQAAERYPNNADVLAALGYIARREGHLSECLGYLQSAFKLDPRNLSLSRDIAQALNGARRYDDARQAWAVVLELFPDSKLMELAANYVDYFESGSQTSIDSWIAGLSEEEKADTVIKSNLAAIALSRGNYPEYLELTNYASANLSNPDTAINQAYVLRILGKKAESDSILHKMNDELTAQLTLQPDDIGVTMGLASTKALLGEKEEALELADRCIELMPESKDVLVGRGIAFARAMILVFIDHREEALDEFDRLLKLPWSPVNVHVLKDQAVFDRLREMPRFQEIVNDPANNAPLF